MRRAVARIRPCPVFHDTRVQPLSQQPNQPPVTDAVLHKPYQPIPRDRVEVRADVRIDYPAHLSLLYPVCQCIERIVRPPPRPESIAESEKPASYIGVRTTSTTAWTSSTAATPSGRVPPSGWGCSPAEPAAPGTPPFARGGAGRAAALPTPPRTLPTSSRPPPAPPPGSVPSRRLPALPARWWYSAVRRSFGFLSTACRIRSVACVTLSRHCVRRVL